MKRNKRILIISGILALIGVSCILSNAFPELFQPVATETPAAHAITPTQIATSAQIPDGIATASVTPAPNVETIQFSEADVLGWITAYSDSSSDFTITNPSVTLDNGLGTVTGALKSGILKGNVTMTLTVTLDSGSNPVIEVQTLQLNGSNLPDSVKSSISDSLNQSIGPMITNSLKGKTIQSISIENGFLTIVTGK